MSQRREIEGRLALYDELTGILGAMRSFALAELRKVGKRETAQQEIVASLSDALLDLSGGLPAALYADPGHTAGDIWLLFGSVRGFCGSFNEDVMRFWRGRADQNNTVLLVGERLHAMIAETTPAQRLSGAEGSLDAPIVIERILAAIMALRGSVEFGLMACIRDEKGVLSQRLWPLPPPADKTGSYPPLTYQPLTEVAAGVAEQYLFHALLALLLRSIRVENHMRLMQMETALRHLEKGGEELQRQRNRLRQEEIVEEIELMVGRR